MLAGSSSSTPANPQAPSDDHTDADALVLEQLHRCDDTVLDGEPLHGSVDDPAIGI